MTQTVLILGAAGRCGRACAKAFADAGWRVRVQVRPGRAAPAGQVVRCDAHDSNALAEAARGVDVIVNALNAPYTDWARELPRQAEAVIAAARVSGATVMIPGNVYVYGSLMPGLLSEATPHRPDGKKGRLRGESEALFGESAAPSGESEGHSGESGVRTVILRAGDFLEGAATGNWFDAVIAKDAAKGRVVYPGPLDRAHAWAYLPDFARAMVGLAEIRAELAPVEEVGFPGYTLTGRELTEAIAAAAGRPMRNRAFPWWALRLAAPVWPMGRELLEMAYLWRRPHRIDGAKLARLSPGFRPTSLEVAMRDCLTSVKIHPDQPVVGAGRALAADQPV